jgi:hypothetical protein
MASSYQNNETIKSYCLTCQSGSWASRMMSLIVLIPKKAIKIRFRPLLRHLFQSAAGRNGPAY